MYIMWLLGKDPVVQMAHALVRYLLCVMLCAWNMSVLMWFMGRETVVQM